MEQGLNMLLKEVGTVSMTLEGLKKIEDLLDKQIKKDKKRIESWDAKKFHLSSKGFKKINPLPIFFKKKVPRFGGGGTHFQPRLPLQPYLYMLARYGILEVKQWIHINHICQMY